MQKVLSDLKIRNIPIKSKNTEIYKTKINKLF